MQKHPLPIGTLVALAILILVVGALGASFGGSVASRQKDDDIAAISAERDWSEDTVTIQREEIRHLKAAVLRAEEASREAGIIVDDLESVIAAQALEIQRLSKPVAKPAPQVAPRPTPRVIPQVSRSGHLGGVERWRTLVARYFPANAVSAALCVMRGESGGSPSADNGHDCCGLFQLSGDHGTRAQRLDATFNVRTAARLYSASGWRAWQVKPCADCK